MSPLYLRKIRNPVNRVTHSLQQSYPKRPFIRVWVIHHHAIKKRINRRAERGKRSHRGFEILGLDRGGGQRFGIIKGSL